MKNTFRLITALATCLGVSACGGGGGDGDGDGPPTSPTPIQPVVSPPNVNNIGGVADFISPVAVPFSVDVKGGGAYGFYAVGRPKGLENHYGIDLEVPAGTNVYAIRGGIVRRAAHHPCLGNLVIIEHDALSGRGYIYTLLAHLESMSVTLGQYVVQGQTLGKSGNTGTCTLGPHLHVETIESLTRLVWGSADNSPTGHLPNYTSWKDPAQFIAGWSAWVGPGPAATPIAFPPSDFRLTASPVTQSNRTQTYSWSLTWSKSEGAQKYEILRWYYSMVPYSYPGWPNVDPPVETAQIVAVVEANILHFEWQDSYSLPNGTYFHTVRAVNSAGATTAKNASGFGIER